MMGILPLGTSLDNESPRSRSLGCWDALDSLQHLITTDFAPAPSSSTVFTPPASFAEFLVSSGFGPKCPQATKEFWTEQLKKNYEGEEGRKRIRMASINLRDRDGLHLRAGDVKCPVLWLHVCQAHCFYSFIVTSQFFRSSIRNGNSTNGSMMTGHRRRSVQRKKCTGRN